MDKQAVEGKGEAPIELTPYEKMSYPMQQLWEERLLNLVNQHDSLFVADLALSFAFVLWSGFVILSGALYVWDPPRYPFRLNFCYALGGFFLYNAIVGFIRKQSKRNLVILAAQHSNPKYYESASFKKKGRIAKRKIRPAARFLLWLRGFFGLPLSGLSQGIVVLWQFVAVLYYIVNYSRYVLYLGETSLEYYANLFWVVHLTMTAGGVVILIKNAGFLIDTHQLIKNIEGLAGGIFGRGARVTVQNNPKKPDEDNGDKK